MTSLTIRRDGSLRWGRAHIGWIVRSPYGHLLITTAPYRDQDGQKGWYPSVFEKWPHDRFWDQLTAWTGHLNKTAVIRALLKLDPTLPVK